jgi:hypothetical protein
MCLTRHEAAHYRIDLQGELDPSWSVELRGMTVTHVRHSGQTSTQISGELPDQAALTGVINLVAGLGLPILLVLYLGKDGASVPPISYQFLPPAHPSAGPLP